MKKNINYMIEKFKVVINVNKIKLQNYPKLQVSLDEMSVGFWCKRKYVPC